MPATKKRRVDGDVARYRSQVAGLKRAIRNGERPDDGALAAAEENLRTAVLVAHIAKVVDGAPPLTAKQREKLAALLRTSLEKDKPGAATNAEPVTTDQLTSPGRPARHANSTAATAGRGDHPAVT